MSEHALAAGKTFPWHELYVPDASAAKAFYTELLGWGIQEFPMGDMGVYPMFVANGTGIAGIMGTEGNPSMANMPPGWAIYIAVDDVDASARKCEALGGSVMVQALDVPTVGRMSLLKDPQGAMFWVYKPAES